MDTGREPGQTTALPKRSASVKVEIKKKKGFEIFLHNLPMFSEKTKVTTVIQFHFFFKQINTGYETLNLNLVTQCGWTQTASFSLQARFNTFTSCGKILWWLY